MKLRQGTGTEDEVVTVELDVTNAGRRPGAEVVQIYVADEAASVRRPAQELKGFAKECLQPGETHTVAITLNRRAFAFYDETRHGWTVEPGRFTILAGSSSRDIRVQGSIDL